MLVSIGSFAQSPTTIILVRHAEKASEGGNDPELSDAGKQRAELLAKTLSKTKVTAIYSTPYKRTKNTVAPLATAKNLTIETYNPKPEELDALIQKNKGGTVVVAGHSNTTPSFVNYLTGNKGEYPNFDDADYGNIIIVTFVEKGKDVKVVWMSY